MCNQDSVWSDLEVRGARAAWAARGVQAVGGAGQGTGRTAEAAYFANKSESYLNSSKFAILRLLCDALSKSKLSSCHQYLLQLETIFMCLWLAFLSYAIFMLQDIDMNRCLKSFQWRLVAWLEKCHVYLE